MLTTNISWKSGGRLLSLALLGGFTLNPGVSVAPTTHSAPAQAPAHSWTKLQDGWLCRFWSEQDPSTLLYTPPSPNARAGATNVKASADSSRLALQVPMQALLTQSVHATKAIPGSPETLTALNMSNLATDGFDGHCTHEWHVDSQINLVSDDSEWVSNPGGEWPTGGGSDTFSYLKTSTLLALHGHQRPAAPKAAPRKVIQPQTLKKSPPLSVSTTSSTGGGTITRPPSGVPGAWTPVPGHPSYGMGDFAGDPWSQYFGYCTWYAWYRHQNEPLLRLGNAAQWPSNAPSHGLRVGSTPVAGATVVFQPGVEGAGGGGHAAHVEAVLSGGWFIISEMNFSWNGGGWGRIDWRYAYVAPGVSFIY
ncbi:MAG: CHAP domain-containing protein [Ktedonobacterales bacterium]